MKILGEISHYLRLEVFPLSEMGDVNWLTTDCELRARGCGQDSGGRGGGGVPSTAQVTC